MDRPCAGGCTAGCGVVCRDESISAKGQRRAGTAGCLCTGRGRCDRLGDDRRTGSLHRGTGQRSAGRCVWRRAGGKDRKGDGYGGKVRVSDALFVGFQRGEGAGGRGGDARLYRDVAQNGGSFRRRADNLGGGGRDAGDGCAVCTAVGRDGDGGSAGAGAGCEEAERRGGADGCRQCTVLLRERAESLRGSEAPAFVPALQQPGGSALFAE